MLAGEDKRVQASVSRITVCCCFNASRKLADLHNVLFQALGLLDIIDVQEH